MLRDELRHRGHCGLQGLRNFHPRRNDDFLRHFFVDGLYVVVAAIVVEDADHRRMRASDRAQDAAFGAAIGAERTLLRPARDRRAWTSRWQAEE